MADGIKKNKEVLSRKDWIWLRNWLGLKETKMVDSRTEMGPLRRIKGGRWKLLLTEDVYQPGAVQSPLQEDIFQS